MNDRAVNEPAVRESGPTCETCGSGRVPGDRFCETCGSPFADAPAIGTAAATMADQRAGTPAIGAAVCAACGATGVDGDGYCMSCGVKQPGPREHIEVDLGRLAGVCDRGIRHAINQDAMEIWSDDTGMRHVIVVCDGVSSASASDVAAQAATKVAMDRLVRALMEPPAELGTAMIDAARLAQASVVATPFEKTPDLDSPSCTFVAAAVRGCDVIVGWIGDSRAYWLSDVGSRQLSVDDSWATAMVVGGLMTMEEAEADNRAHQITRWLGADAPDVIPTMTEFRVDAPGELLLCSDGLWNYAPGTDALAALIASVAEPRTSLAAARHLCTFANGRGGHDNITVALCPLDPSTETSAPKETPQMPQEPSQKDK